MTAKELYDMVLMQDFFHRFQMEMHPDTVQELILDMGYLDSHYIPKCMWENFEKQRRSFLSFVGVQIFLNSTLPKDTVCFLEKCVHPVRINDFWE